MQESLEELALRRLAKSPLHNNSNFSSAPPNSSLILPPVELKKEKESK
jgi:hypothetical protein